MALTAVYIAPMQARLGKSWDEQSRDWVNEPGTALAVDDDAYAGARQRWKPSSLMGRDPSESDFYAILGVQRDATPEQIKKQVCSIPAFASHTTTCMRFCMIAVCLYIARYTAESIEKECALRLVTVL